MFVEQSVLQLDVRGSTFKHGLKVALRDNSGRYERDGGAIPPEYFSMITEQCVFYDKKCRQVGLLPPHKQAGQLEAIDLETLAKVGHCRTWLRGVHKPVDPNDVANVVYVPSQRSWVFSDAILWSKV